MKREADNNRVTRAMEHIMAAVTNLKSIKDEHRSDDDDAIIKDGCEELATVWRALRILIKNGGNG